MNSKSCFGAHKFDYLGYHVTRDGFMPTPKKVEAIQALAVTKMRKQLRQCILVESSTWTRPRECLVCLKLLERPLR